MTRKTGGPSTKVQPVNHHTLLLSIAANAPASNTWLSILMAVITTSVSVLGGCMTCMWIVEQLAKKDPGCMNLMTFSTFLFISLEGLVFSTDFLRKPRNIPIKGYLKVVMIFFIVNVVNNQALNFHVPVPLHIIFRSGSLLASLLLGKLVLHRTYSVKKYVSVLVITVGIITCTLADSQIEKKAAKGEAEEQSHYFEWTIGIIMLSFALIASAYLGICQERLYSQYGKHSREAMFYVHALALPMFALFSGDILTHARIFSASTPVTLLAGVSVPELWLLLVACDLFQYLCIRFVYLLTSEVQSLTVTLVVTLRKFLSLLVSIWYFQNPFTPLHWLGTAAVFSGTLLFADWGSAAPAVNKQVANGAEKKEE